MATTESGIACVMVGNDIWAVESVQKSNIFKFGSINLACTDEVGAKAGSLEALNGGLAWRAGCIGLR